jgi:hypothetical protein
MCIDFTSLNKHCPKDHFLLPCIDQIVDSTTGYERLPFLDAYSGYNQIRLKEEDRELTASITPHGVFCYNAMTSSLKNAGATYQRCMQACLKEHISRNIEIYIDAIVIKTRNELAVCVHACIYRSTMSSSRSIKYSSTPSISISSMWIL